MSVSLMTTRRFAPLFWCQFFSAFNDNFLKNALVFLILFKLGGKGCRGAHILRGRGVHRAVLLPLRPRRPARRPLRQGDGGAAPEARRDRRGRLCRRGLPPCNPCLTFMSRAVPVRRDRRAVRPDQIRHPARPSGTRRTAGRQRAGRGRDLHRHPARHHRGRARRQGRRQPGLVRRPDDGLRARCAGRRAC